MASSIYRLGNLSPQAVAWTLFSLPLVAGMFYILSAKIGIIGCRPRGYMNETRCRLLYVFTEILMGVIVLTYAWELSCLSLVPFLRTVINWVEGTVYLLGSVIFWCILLFVFLKARGVLRISLGGCALLYLVPELFLLTSSVYPTQVGKIMAKFLMSIRATRFVTLVLLLCVIIGSCTVPCHREPDLEATASLIPNGHACRDVVHNKQVKSINYGATTQESDHSQSNLRSRQPRRRSIMGAASSRRLQPHSALQGIEEEVQTEGTDDIDGNDQGQILGNEIPVMRIAKLRHNPKARQGDQGEVQHIQFVDHSEFIPIPQQRVAMQQVERQQDLGVKETQRHGLDDERDLSRTVNSQMGKSAVPSFPITNENESPRPAASTKHRSHAAEGGSSQFTAGSRQASDRVIMAYPKKARKRGRRSRKEAMSRRKGTKSEPAGIGLTTDIDHSSY